MLIKFMLNQTICLKPTCSTSLGRNFLCVASSYISPRNQRNPCCFPISEIRFLACLGLFITTINKSRPEGWLHLKNAFLSDRISALSPMLSRHIFNAKNYLLKWRKQNSCAVINHWPQAGPLMYRKENGNSFLTAPLTSHPTSAMGTGRAFSRWDGKTRKHNFCAFLITLLSTATVSMYI